ncbi:MAG TPA: Lrp/AsnC family transcriptional regulator [Candidatus Norongarragalinales archaeon]|nr:Lrp/AsnC family transcriptional regulator [Candidatus Norongarragalinales archaeon]
MDVLMDELDGKIVEELEGNSRLSFREMAKKLGVSTSTIAQHSKMLEREKIVRRYSVDLDWEKLGFDLTALIELTIRGQPLLKVQAQIAKLPQVVSVWDITGRFDSMALVRVKNRRELSATVKKILDIEGVEHSDTHLILNTVKENYLTL